MSETPEFQTRMAVIDGDGVVLRHQSVIVVLGRPGDDAQVEPIRAALLGDDGDGPGRVRAVARLLLGDTELGYGAVIALDDPVEVFAVGAVDLLVGSGRISAASHTLGLSERLAPGDLHAVLPEAEEAPPVPPWAELVAGAVSGGGVVFAGVTAAVEPPPPSERPEPEPEPTPATPPPAPSAPGLPSVPTGERFELVSLTASVDLSDREPVPVVAEAEPPADEDLPPYARPVHVQGVLSPKGFFNHPDAAYCSRSGVKMGASHTRAFTDGVRPPLGVFTFDDGSTCSVQWDMVIGRDPRTDERVVDQTAAPFSLTDVELKVSRRHLRVDLVGWDVLVEDLGTANGTFVQEGNGGARRLAPGEKFRLRTGSQVYLGDRSFVYHEHHVR